MVHTQQVAGSIPAPSISLNLERCTVKDFLATNWRLGLLLLTIVLAPFGVNFTAKPGPPGSKVEIQVIYPEDATPSFQMKAGGSEFNIHPRLHFFLRAKLSGEVMKTNGCTFAEAWNLTRVLKPDDYAAAYGQAAKESKVEAASKYGQIGDGSILKAIMEWLQSPQGQAFLDAVMKILLALLMASANGQIDLDHCDIGQLIELLAACSTFLG